MDNIVCDLIILKFDDKKNEWFEYDKIYCLNNIFYHDSFKCLFVKSHGLLTKIKHFEDFRFEFRFRYIDYDDASLEKTYEKI